MRNFRSFCAGLLTSAFLLVSGADGQEAPPKIQNSIKEGPISGALSGILTNPRPHEGVCSPTLEFLELDDVKFGKEAEALPPVDIPEIEVWDDGEIKTVDKVWTAVFKLRDCVPDDGSGHPREYAYTRHEVGEQVGRAAGILEPGTPRPDPHFDLKSLREVFEKLNDMPCERMERLYVEQYRPHYPNSLAMCPAGS